MGAFRLNHLFLLAISFAGLLQTSCAPQADESDPTAITNRPQQYDRFIAIARLQQAPLLQSATRSPDGTLTINQLSQIELEAEQQEFLSQIQSRFTDIQILHRYRYTINAVVIAAPIQFKDEFVALDAVSFVESSGAFASVPRTLDTPNDDTSTPQVAAENPNTLIGARAMATLSAETVSGEPVPVTGQGLRIGVIDTGIDYFHKALGGSGDASQYTANDPKTASDGSFPNAKVVGGIDLVGATYNPASPYFDDHIPQPDNDPVDVQGHGTHVAATIAGIGDQSNTYDGVAPAASLYAIKVFSDGGYGSTSDHIVIAALEYAVDPNQDGAIDDKLDVINLSLGSNFGTEHILYEEALTNLVNYGDIVAACSAGNSGDEAFIVGAPSTVPAAISIAASVDQSVEQGRLTDTLASFSSRGPRSLDGAFKPEIAAPGYQILSAKVGSGAKGTRKSGTSMAAPHIAGALALLKQKHPEWHAQQLKDALLATAVPMKARDGKDYNLALQGAGRVDVFKAATVPLSVEPATLSLGLQSLAQKESFTRTVSLTNQASASRTVQLIATTTPGFSVEVPSEALTIGPGETKTLTLVFTVDPAGIKSLQTLNARIQLDTDQGETLRIHAMVTTREGSEVLVKDVQRSTDKTTLVFHATKPGKAQVFRMLARDEATPPSPTNPFREDGCDLAEVGYRVISKTIDGKDTRVLQIAATLSSPVTTWHVCEISTLVDLDQDGIPDQELLGTYLSQLSEAYQNAEGRFFSFLMNADAMRQTRRQIEDRYSLFTHTPEDYIGSAMVGYRPFAAEMDSRVAIVEAKLSEMTSADTLRVQVAALSGSGSPGADDFLTSQGQSWFTLKTAKTEDLGMETIDVTPDADVTIDVPTADPLLVVMPSNQYQGSFFQAGTL